MHRRLRPDLAIPRSPRRTASFLGLFLIAAAASAQPDLAAPFAEVLRAAAELGIERRADLRYHDTPGVDPERASLDVWTSPDLVLAPVVLFLHGGAWQRGDKRAVLNLPLALVPAGYVVVSANYRFRPQVTVAEQAGDAARAAAWVRQHIGAHGGDPSRVVLAGHSAGAHLVSVIGTNGAFLAEQGMKLGDLRGVVSLDTGPYDVAVQMERTPAESRYGQLLRSVFGDDRDAWSLVSPLRHVAPSRGIPPFLVFASARRADVEYQAEPFVAALGRAGVEAELFVAEGKTHETLMLDLGKPGEAITDELLAFLAARSGASATVPAVESRP